MQFRRNIKRYVRGDDVKYIKDLLVKLNYLYKSTHGTFGNDSYRAVIEYQKRNKDIYGRQLDVDGIVGKLTWGAIVRDAGEVIPVTPPEENAPSFAIPSNISSSAAALIAKDLMTVSDKRRSIVLDALRFAYDKNKPQPHMTSLYIRGGNIYNRDLKPNIISIPYLTGSYKKRYGQYCDGGRLEYMVAAVKADSNMTGADCSGGVVGLCRKAKVVSSGFDATANSLCGNSHSEPISKNSLHPGDWVGRSGHIGLYVGGGYIVEWLGGAYGCCLTGLNELTAYNFVDGKLHKFSRWTKFRDPKYY